MFITDTIRCVSPSTFMSNMLYASSVLYKSQLPMLLVFNKIDIVSCQFAEEWMKDFEAYQNAIDSNSNDNSANNEEYMNSLNRSLCLVMDEFYR